MTKKQRTDQLKELKAEFDKAIQRLTTAEDHYYAVEDEYSGDYPLNSIEGKTVLAFFQALECEGNTMPLLGALSAVASALNTAEDAKDEIHNLLHPSPEVLSVV